MLPNFFKSNATETDGAHVVGYGVIDDARGVLYRSLFSARSWTADSEKIKISGLRFEWVQASPSSPRCSDPSRKPLYNNVGSLRNSCRVCPVQGKLGFSG